MVRQWMLWIGIAALPLACAAPVALEGSGCDPDHPCPEALACQHGACVQLTGFVVPGCDSDEACAFGVCCGGTCAQCCTDEDCFGSACLEDGSCGCTSGGQCMTGRCNQETSQCLSCYSDTHCDSQDCDLGTGVCTIAAPAGEAE